MEAQLMPVSGRKHEKIEVYNSPLILERVYPAGKFLIVPSPGKMDYPIGDLFALQCKGRVFIFQIVLMPPWGLQSATVPRRLSVTSRQTGWAGLIQDNSYPFNGNYDIVYNSTFH